MINVYANIMYSTKKKINKVINDYLDIYIDFYRNLGPEEAFSSFFPSIIWKENKEKCEKVILELYEWTNDDFFHTLTPLHEYALYVLLTATEESMNDINCLKENTTGYDEDNDIGEDQYILKDLHNFNYYFNVLFQDFDFLNVSDYYRLFKASQQSFESFNMHLDDYIDLMPEDIKEEFLAIKMQHVESSVQVNERVINGIDDLLFHVDKILEYFAHSISMKNAYKLLWNDNKSPKKESSIQILLNNISGIYCRNNNIDLIPEAETGRGPVDLKFSYGDKLKVIIEVKLASNNNLLHGVEHQIVQYMLSERVEFAYFIVVFLHDKDLNKIDLVIEAIKKVEENHELHIKPIFIDARYNKPSASRTIINPQIK
ncbi:hypothetical protein PghCCS26_40260 [Paenibacillus glycanilyticus]|uniref:Uncharacterized protein n=1 Tax=Paenibacillus glycanilyticus TaxID=126569 RepID=A0ABQ6NRP7_9BACL|nr:hypothetical protein [Paenibacillus glycanilyticus]GMK46897.1 hypothetical protein PghCCS26_40260 [Paenibacillus glycanilyticus]